MPAALVTLTIRTPPAGCCTCVIVSSGSDGRVDIGCVLAADADDDEGRIAEVSEQSCYHRCVSTLTASSATVVPL
jgi:hypothetical protein